MTKHDLWDQKSSADFNSAECDLANMFERFDREWCSEEGMSPSDALTRCQQMRRMLDFMMAAAKWAA